MLKIGKTKISLNRKPVLVSEISGNHAGSLNNALKLIKHAAISGSELIKIQTYEANKITLNSNKSDFLIKDKKNLWKKNKLYNLYKKGQTSKEWHYKIFNYAKKLNVDCFTSIFDEGDIEFLEKLKIPAYKIASFENTHFPLIEKVIKTKKPILISLGLSSFKEIEELIKLLKNKKCKNFALLKCTSADPANLKSLNLATIAELRKKYKCEIGFSDHSIGFNAAIGSIHHGASFVEKHICLNNRTGIDAKFSLPANKIKNFKKEMNKAYDAKGKIFFGPTEEEKLYLKFRRSIYASKEIKKGEVLSEKNIKIIRPGYGLEPKYFKNIIGKKAKMKIDYATAIKWKHIKN